MLLNQRSFFSTTVNQDYILIIFQAKPSQDSEHLGAFLTSEEQDYLQCTWSIASSLVDLNLFFEIPLKLGIASKFELDKRLINASTRDLEINWAPSIVHLAADLRRRSLIIWSCRR